MNRPAFTKAFMYPRLFKGALMFLAFALAAGTPGLKTAGPAESCLAPALGRNINPARETLRTSALEAVAEERKNPGSAAHDIAVPAAGPSPASGAGGAEFLFFLKPEAVSPGGLDAALDVLFDSGLPLQVLSARAISGKAMREGDVIATHYGAINRAARLGGEVLSADAKAKFREVFGLSADEAQIRGALELVQQGLLSAREITAVWNDGLTRYNKPDGVTKIAPGLYAVRHPVHGYFILNGFHLSQLDQYLDRDDNVVLLFRVRAQCDAATLAKIRSRFNAPENASLLDILRLQVIGDTNPAKAVPGSLRRTYLDNWQTLGLAQTPDMQKNGCHFSAGPVEAMRELYVWFGSDIQNTETGRLMLSRGIPADVVRALRDHPPSVTVLRDGNPKQMPLFDATEGLDPAAALDALLETPELVALTAESLKQSLAGPSREEAGRALLTLFEKSYPLFIGTLARLIDTDEPAAQRLLEAALSTLAPAFVSGPETVLGSSSPRRKKILQDAGIAFRVQTADSPEKRVKTVRVESASKAIAAEKLVAVMLKLSREGLASPVAARAVITADTTVVNPVTGELMGKPPVGEEAAFLAQFLGTRILNFTSLASFDPATGRVILAQDRADLLLPASAEPVAVSREKILAELKAYLQSVLDTPDAALPTIAEGRALAAKLLAALGTQQASSAAEDFEAWLISIYAKSPNFVENYPVLAPLAVSAGEETLRLTAGDFAARYARVKSAGKAGGYGVQDPDFREFLVREIAGNVQTIIGLPVARVRLLLEERPTDLRSAA